MKTKNLSLGILLYLINTLIAFGQTTESYPVNDTVVRAVVDSAMQSEELEKWRDETRQDTFVRKSTEEINAIIRDSLNKKPERSQVISSKVEYNAQDSTIYSLDGKKVYLFGKGVIKYEDILLEADYIEVDMERGIIYAEGVPDSLGVMKGSPFFKQGGEEMKSKSITYNMKTEKGYIKGLYAEQDDGYLHSEKTKKAPNNHINLYRGKYTTCELEEPHFYIKLSKGKVIPNKAIISSYAYMVIGDIPLYPLMIPFGFFPNSQEKASGFLIPTFGEENARGFYLREGGYYFNFGEYADLAVKGDIYSKGSWQVGAQSKYKLRYKFSGNVDVAVSNIVAEQKGSSELLRSNEYKVKWVHTQDPKARPNSNFSANVNFTSMGNNKYNETSPDQYLTNTTQSSISYRKTFQNSPFSASMNLRHSQNSRDSIVNLTLPQMTVNMRRVFPFQRKNPVGKKRWYENIGVTYTGNFENKLSTKDSLLFTSSSLNKFENGVKHAVPLSTSLKLLKYFNLSPNANYTERWYFKQVDKNVAQLTDPTSGELYDSVYYDTTSGFNRVYDYSYGVGFGTTIYGMYQYKSDWLKAIRHVLTPSVSFSYRPDFADERFGYYKTDPTDSTRLYSYYNGAIYGIPGTGNSGNLSFSLNNNVEMKVASKKDTVNNETKIKLLESLNFSTGYNLIADSLNWSPISMSARTTLFKMISINASASADLYALDSAGSRRINTFEHKATGSPFRITSARISTGISLNSKTLFNNEDAEESDVNSGMFMNNFYGYDYFDIPWDVRLDYSLSYSKSGFTPNTTQTLSFSGNFSLTPNWKIGFRSGWDFQAKDISYTSFNLSRDLHCWVATVNVVPFGPRQSYNFTIGVKSAVLQDLKLNKNKSWYDNGF